MGLVVAKLPLYKIKHQLAAWNRENFKRGLVHVHPNQLLFEWNGRSGGALALFFQVEPGGRFVLKVFEIGSKRAHLDLQVFRFLTFVFDRTQARFA